MEDGGSINRNTALTLTSDPDLQSKESYGHDP